MIRKYLIMISILMTALAVFPVMAQETGQNAGQDNETKQTYTQDDVYAQIELFSTAFSHVLSNYYKDLTREDLEKFMTDGAIKGMLEGLGDRYSFYQAESSRKREQENLFYARFGGLGIRILPSPDGFINIVQPMDGSPAMKAGLRAGDRIVRVDGNSIENWSIEDVVDILRGEVGTKVTVTIVRPGREMPFDVTVIRDIISFPSVRSIIIGDNIGYISLSSFTAETPEEMKKSIDDLNSKGMKGLILDLRNNTGGMMSSAVAVSNAFIPEGVIVSTDGRIDKFDSMYLAKKENLVCSPDMPFILLVNNNSASGSEIVAGAIKDYERGKIIGEVTFGKGVVQQRFPLDEERAVSITVSIYKTPKGEWIHEKYLFDIGLEIQSDLDDAKVSERLQKAFADNGIAITQETPIYVKIKGLKWQVHTDQRTYNVKKEERKLKVYKGGIEPDIWVEQPRLFEEEDDGVFTKLFEGEYVDKFVYDHIEKNKDKSDSEQLELLMSRVEELKEILTENEISLSDRAMKMLLRRTFASAKYIPNIDLENDYQLAKAVEEMNNLIK